MIVSEVACFKFEYHQLLVDVPVSSTVQAWHLQNIDEPFPYWAKIWPSAKALSNFLYSNQKLVTQKKVVEIASGLGLPSLTAALFTSEVICTDYVQEPLVFVQSSAQKNNLQHIQTELFNWQSNIHYIPADVVLLSDVNYHTKAFEYLYSLINYYLNTGGKIILATPQRITASLFVEPLMAYVQEKVNYVIDDTDLSVLLLKKN